MTGAILSAAKAGRQSMFVWIVKGWSAFQGGQAHVRAPPVFRMLYLVAGKHPRTHADSYVVTSSRCPQGSLK
jgi:hypothetical protein